MKKTNRPLVLASVMLAMFIGAVEATIVSTAMPSISAELGGFSKYSWVFSAYLLMSTVTVLLYGKLSDIFGRKPIFAVGIILFLLGSLLCGLATSMEQLIFFRFVQGIGAGRSPTHDHYGAARKGLRTCGVTQPNRRRRVALAVSARGQNMLPSRRPPAAGREEVSFLCSADNVQQTM